MEQLRRFVGDATRGPQIAELLCNATLEEWADIMAADSEFAVILPAG